MFLLDGPECPFADSIVGTELGRLLREGDEDEVKYAHLEHEAGVDELVQSLQALAEDAKNPKKLSEPVAAAAAATQASDAAVLAATVDAGGISVCGASSSSDVPAPAFGPLSRTATIANSTGRLRLVGLKDYHWIDGGDRAGTLHVFRGSPAKFLATCKQHTACTCMISAAAAEGNVMRVETALIGWLSKRCTLGGGGRSHKAGTPKEKLH